MMFKAKNLVLLNPTFGEGSDKIGRVDADLLFDDTLLGVTPTFVPPSIKLFKGNGINQTASGTPIPS